MPVGVYLQAFQNCCVTSLQAVEVGLVLSLAVLPGLFLAVQWKPDDGRGWVCVAQVSSGGF